MAQRPSFHPNDIDRALQFDQLLRGITLVGLFGLLVAVVISNITSWIAMVVFILVMLGWFALNTISGRVYQALDQVTQLIEAQQTPQDLNQAEAQLTQLMAQRPLVRWLRLLIFHRLAMIRFRQERYAEALTIVNTILGHPVSRRFAPVAQLRPGMLVMAIEAALELNQPALAYPALLTLYELERRGQLPMAEQLQRLHLQTEYEWRIYALDAMLQDVELKIRRAEIMPGIASGEMHLWLAEAAEHAGDGKLSHWLRERADLLLDEESKKDLLENVNTQTSIAS